MATAQNPKLFISNNGVHGTLIEGEELDSHFKDMNKTLLAPGCDINMKERIIHQLKKQGDPGTTCLVVFEVHGTIEEGRQPRGINLVQECKFPFELFHLEMTAPGCSVLAQPGLSATVTRFLGEIPGKGVLSRDATDLSLMKNGLYFFVIRHPANKNSEKLNVTFETELSLTAKLNLINIYILDPAHREEFPPAKKRKKNYPLKCITITPPRTSERDDEGFGKFEKGADGTLSYTEGIHWTEPPPLRGAAVASGHGRVGARTRCDTSYIDVSYFIQQAKEGGGFGGLFSLLERAIMLRGNCSPSYATFPATHGNQPMTRGLATSVDEYSSLMTKVSKIFFNGFKFGLLVSHMVSKIREFKKEAPPPPPGDSGTNRACIRRVSSLQHPQSDAKSDGEKGEEEEILNRYVIELLMNHMLEGSKEHKFFGKYNPTEKQTQYIAGVVKTVSSLFVDVDNVALFNTTLKCLLSKNLTREMTKFDLVSPSDKSKIEHDYRDSNIFPKILESQGEPTTGSPAAAAGPAASKAPKG